MRIKQGDAYDIEISLADDNETEITPEIVDVVEVVLGVLRKTFPGDITWDNAWIFPLTQKDSFRLEGVCPLKVRVKFSDGTVAGCCPCVLAVTPATKEEVI